MILTRKPKWFSLNATTGITGRLSSEFGWTGCIYIKSGFSIGPSFQKNLNKFWWLSAKVVAAEPKSSISFPWTKFLSMSESAIGPNKLFAFFRKLSRGDTASLGDTRSNKRN